MKNKILYLAVDHGLSIEQSGGAGTHMRGTIKGFREYGFDVLPIIGRDVLESERDSGLNKEYSERKKSIRDLVKLIIPEKLRLMLRDCRTMWVNYRFERRSIKAIKSFNPDFIYERSAYLSRYGSRLARMLKTPHFLESDGCMIEIINKDYGMFSPALGNAIERKKLKRADYVVVMNKHTIPMIRKKHRLKNKKIIVKPLGVDVSDFNFDIRAVGQLKKTFSLNDKFVIGFVGAISSYHGVHYLVDAAQYLALSNPNIVIIIVGWSKEGEALQKRVINSNLKNIVFTGKVSKSDVANYYSLFNVGVIPDCEESMYPIKALEYGIFGICPLVPRYDIFRDIINEGERGYFFYPKDAKSLSDTVLRMYSERQKCDLCGTNWRRFVDENFTWKNTVKDIVNYLSVRH